jgi:hypothetical protein
MMAKDEQTTAKADKAPDPEAALAPSAKPKAKSQDAPVVSVQSFLRTSGQRPEQTAGFSSYASRALPGKKTQADWQAAFAQFHQKSVR